MIADTNVLDRARHLFRAGQLADADVACRAALQANSKDVDALALLARIQIEFGRPGVAAAFLNRAIALRPEDANLHYRLGIAAQARGDARAAESSLKRALELSPNTARYHYALGTLLLEQRQLAPATAFFRTAIELDPSFASAHVNLGIALLGQATTQEALAHLRQALSLKPDQPDVHSNVLLMQQYDSSATRSQTRLAAEEWARRFAPSSDHGASPHDNNADPDRRLRIGYVSADFRQHSVAYLIEPILAAHDRTRVEIFCYSNNRIVDDITRRLQVVSDQFIEVDALSDSQLADRIRTDAIDILVDLSGHTGGNRLPVFAMEPAPVQATWLGYSGTTGLRQIDHIFVDAIVCPPGQEDEFSERVVRLQPSYMTYQPDSSAPPVRPLKTVGVGEVTFASFNNAAKITAPLIRAWAAILHQMPRATLLLKSAHFDEPAVVERFVRLFEEEGVAASQLQFRGRTTRAELFELYGDVHVALDTFPYAGCLTSLEALWMGVPVVSLSGDRFVGRMGASIMNTLDLPELVATTPEDYVARAIGLGRDLERVSDLRSSLRGRMQRSPLCDAQMFTRGLEHAYRAMWHEWCADSGERKEPR